MAGKWINKAREKMEKKGTVGSLREEAKAEKGKPIGKDKLAALKAKAKKTGDKKLAKKVQFAENVKK
jgi:hypothetical protein